MALTVVAGAPRAQEQRPGGAIETIQVRPNVYMLAGAGGNIAVHVGWMGVVLVDTGSAEMSDQVLAAIGRITDERIRFIINTTAEADHVGGNASLAQAGLTLLRYNRSATGGFAGSDFQTNFGAAGIMAHENVLRRMSASERPTFPGTGWPTEAYSGARVRSLYLNGDGIQMFYQPEAHSDADTIVFFRRADVVVAGDILDLRQFPVIDVEHGGTIDGEIAALNRLIDLTVPPAPLVWHEDRTLVIPGHGRVCDQADVVEYRDMTTVIRDRIKDMIGKGMTLDQITRADPTFGYRRQYGSDTGPWTTEMFVTAVHRTLTAGS
ncbi:MAG: MBL fold metallo-hydrolase [Acidobacteria bacterium]|nr:MBL fold metallo-hydrolase [Acidobacteriota bacterium]